MEFVEARLSPVLYRRYCRRTCESGLLQDARRLAQKQRRESARVTAPSSVLLVQLLALANGIER
jgi:hypothetical protein